MAQQLKAKNFGVQPGHMLCRQCITAYENITASSLDTEAEQTTMDDIMSMLWMMQGTKCMRHQENVSVRVWKRLACVQ